MAFGALQRKSSNPVPYQPRKARGPTLQQRRRLKTTAIFALFGVAIVWILLRLFSGERDEVPPHLRAPAGTPEVVIVTVIDPHLSEKYVSQMKTNREDYAARHGYKNFYASPKDYDLGNSPSSWAVIPAVRHAMTLNPYSTYFYSLSAHALFMNPTLNIVDHVMAPKRLESLMLKDKPVVPPDSVIHTFSHLKGDRIDLVLTQDGEGLCQESFIVRQGDWAKFFLDVWYDPLYRSYNFQKAEGHALEHIVQWHPTILTKLALIPQRIINAYTVDIPSRGGKTVTYQNEDFVVRAVGCEKDANRHCEDEMEPWFKRWKEQYGVAKIEA